MSCHNISTSDTFQATSDIILELRVFSPKYSDDTRSKKLLLRWGRVGSAIFGLSLGLENFPFDRLADADPRYGENMHSSHQQWRSSKGKNQHHCMQGWWLTLTPPEDVQIGSDSMTHQCTKLEEWCSGTDSHCQTNLILNGLHSQRINWELNLKSPSKWQRRPVVVFPMGRGTQTCQKPSFFFPKNKTGLALQRPLGHFEFIYLINHFY